MRIISAMPLAEQRWALASSASESCLVISTPDGPRGVRLKRSGDDLVAYSIGAFLAFVSVDGNVYTVREEDSDAADDALAQEWIAAGTPMLRRGGSRE